MPLSQFAIGGPWRNVNECDIRGCTSFIGPLEKLFTVHGFRVLSTSWLQKYNGFRGNDVQCR